MGDSGKIDAVTFDVGGTLIEPWPSVGHVYAQVAAKHGAGNLSPEMLNRRFAAAWQDHPGFDYTAQDWSAIVDATFAGVIADKPSETFFPELFERFAQADAWRIFDDVLPTLAALTDHGLRLGVISNWDDRLRPLLSSLGLTRNFEIIVVSCELAAGKPSAVPFQTAAKAFGLRPAQILHVGDSADLDVAGASAAGFQAAQIVRGDRAGGKDQMTCLHDLVALALTPKGAR